jgi:hypothetical protein
MLRNTELANPLASRPTENRPFFVYDHYFPSPFMKYAGLARY